MSRSWDKVEPVLVKAEHADFIITWIIRALFTLGLGAVLNALLHRVVELSGNLATGALLICLATAFAIVWRVSTLLAKRGVSVRMILYVFVPAIAAALFGIWACVIGLRVYKIFHDVERLKVQAVRYSLPRSLTEDQKVAISSYLAATPPKAIIMKVLKNDAEAGGYRADLQQAIEKGGWGVTRIDYVDDIPQGLALSYSAPMPQTTTDKFGRTVMKESPDDPLAKALDSAGVAISQRGGGGGVATTETTITLSIGGRRRDRWSVMPKNYLPPAMRGPNYPTDDDFR